MVVLNFGRFFTARVDVSRWHANEQWADSSLRAPGTIQATSHFWQGRLSAPSLSLMITQGKRTLAYHKRSERFQLCSSLEPQKMIQMPSLRMQPTEDETFKIQPWMGVALSSDGPALGEKYGEVISDEKCPH